MESDVWRRKAEQNACSAVGLRTRRRVQMGIKMSLLDALGKEEVWWEFCEYKKEKAHLSVKDENALFSFIREKKYLPMAQELADGEYNFGYPRKILINKMGKKKKRVVYSYEETETMLLKLLAWLLYQYDNILMPNVYSFRRDYGAARAVKTIAGQSEIGSFYGYKADISDYFNSINVEKLLPMLEKKMEDDVPLYHFLSYLLTQDMAWERKQLIREKRGVMAGTPIAPFLANVYLTEMDGWFYNKGAFYARYSDDIICFAPSEEVREEYRLKIYNLVKEYGLEINAEKENFYAPGEEWEFLGICYRQGKVDLSKATINKMKGKIRRKARGIYRWKKAKGMEDWQAARALIKIFNRKFFTGGDANDLTWCRWFFPILTTSSGLREIDKYLQQYIRYLATGHHNKKNYRIDYEMMKDCGYRSLVHEYYLYKEEQRKERAERDR